MPDPSPESLNRTAAHVSDLEPAASTDATAAQTGQPGFAEPGVPAVPGYEVRGEIACGGMGRVFAARDRVLDREVAIKVLLPGLPPAEAAARFVREAKITAKLPHPGIPPVHALGTLPDGGPFLAMKLIRGRTLDALLKERAAPGDDLPGFVRVFEQICQAVGFAHTQGVVHRDLKPANVMVGAFGEVQVMDWGIAKSADGSRETVVGDSPDRLAATGGGESETQAGQVMGTPAYMAPEQARGDVVGARADVFALGGLLCAVLTGKPSFTGKSTAEVLGRAAAADVGEALGRLGACGADAELVALARRCLSPDPADRPADGREVADAAAAYRAGVEDRLRKAEAEHAAAVARESEGRRRRRWQRIAAGVFALLVAGGAAFAWWEDSEAGKRRAEALQKRIEDEERAREDRDRVIKNGGALSSWVEQCEVALKGERADVAETAQMEIDRRLPGGGADDFRPRVDRCRIDLAMLKELDRIDNDRWTNVANAQLPSLEHNAAAWSAAFRRFGIVPGQTPPAEVARRIGDSLIGDRLLAALDLWLLETPTVEVFRLIREIDPDPYRNSIRNTIWLKAPELLGVQSVIGPAFEQPARFALVLGSCPTVPPRRREEILRSAHHKHPTNLAIMMTAAAIYPVNRKEGAAERVGWYRAALAVRPTSTAVWNNLGVSLSDAGDLDGAIEAYREINRLDPKFAPAYHNLAQMMRARGDPDAAIEEYRKAIAADPTFARSHNDLGVVLKEKNDLPGAAACYREAVRLNPKDAVAHFNLGSLLKATGDVDGAMPYLQEAISLSPRFALAHHELGNALNIKRDLDGAIASYQQAIHLDKNFAYSHYHLGLALRDKGDLDGAIARYNEAIRLDPKLALSRYALGIALREKGNPDGAVAAFREAIRLDPKYALAHEVLGGVLGEKNELDGAIGHLKEAVKLDPKRISARLNLGLALSYKGDWDAAIVCLKEVVRLEPKHAAAHAALGTALSEKNELDAAIASYREAIRLDPKLSLAHHNLGNALRAKDDLDGAIASYREAVRHAPGDVMCHEKLGNALKDHGDLDGAVASYREVVRLAPKHAGAHNVLGAALARKGETDAAVSSFKEAIRLDPKFASPRTNLAISLKDRGDLDGAIAACREAIRIDPNYVDAHLVLGHVLGRTGEQDGAVAAFREAVRLAPKSASAHENLGAALAQKGDLDGALVAIREAVRLDPKRAKAHHNLGGVLGARGDLDGAVACFKDALRLDPKYSDARAGLGQALQQKGDLDAALSVYREAVRVHPNIPRFQDRLRQTEWWRELLPKLPDVAAGRAAPAPREALEFAKLCSRPFLRRYVLAVRLYEGAFAADPKLAEDIVAEHRYSAVCYAALAAAGKDSDMVACGVEEWGCLTDRAYQWLRADLAAWTALAKDPKKWPETRETLTHWKKDVDLVAIRDPAWLAAMSARDRKRWEALWADVDALLSAAPTGASPRPKG